MAILQDMSKEQLIAEINRLKAKTSSGPVVKVWPLGETRTNADGEVIQNKGNVCVYGLQRTPVTLYPSQWLRLFTVVDQIKLQLEQKIRQAVLGALNRNEHSPIPSASTGGRAR